MPDFIGAFRQSEARDLSAAVWIEQAKLDTLGMRGKHREVGAQPVPRGAERIGRAALQSGWKSDDIASSLVAQKDRRKRRQDQLERLRLAVRG